MKENYDNENQVGANSHLTIRREQFKIANVFDKLSDFGLRTTQRR